MIPRWAWQQWSLYYTGNHPLTGRLQNQRGPTIMHMFPVWASVMWTAHENRSISCHLISQSNEGLWCNPFGTTMAETIQVSSFYGPKPLFPMTELHSELMKLWYKCPARSCRQIHTDVIHPQTPSANTDKWWIPIKGSRDLTRALSSAQLLCPGVRIRRVASKGFNIQRGKFRED